MATAGVSRASMDNAWQRHGDDGGKPRVERKKNTLEESQRKTAGPEAVHFYSAMNPSIVPEDTAKNIDFVNDGSGGFRTATSIDETLDYGEERLGRVTAKIGDGNTTWITSVFHLPYSLCEEVEDFYPILDDDGNQRFRADGSPAMRSRWIIAPGKEDEAKRYFDEVLKFWGNEVLPGGQAAIHGGSINLDESRPHMQIISDPLEPKPGSEDELKNGFSLAFGSHRKSKMIEKRDKTGRPVIGKNGQPEMRRENASDKAERHHRELKAHLIEAGFDIEADRDAKRHNRRINLDDYQDLKDQESMVDEKAQVADEKLDVADETLSWAENLRETASDEIDEAQATLAMVDVTVEEIHARWNREERPRVERDTREDVMRRERQRWRTEVEPQLIAETESMAELAWRADEMPRLVARVTKETKETVRGELAEERARLAEETAAATAARQAAERARKEQVRLLREATEDRELAAAELGVLPETRSRLTAEVAELQSRRDDLATEIEDRKETAEKEIADRKEEAERDIADARAAARASGYKDGREAGLQKVRATVAQLSEQVEELAGDRQAAAAVLDQATVWLRSAKGSPWARSIAASMAPPPKADDGPMSPEVRDRIAEIRRVVRDLQGGTAPGVSAERTKVTPTEEEGLSPLRSSLRRHRRP